MIKTGFKEGLMHRSMQKHQGFSLQSAFFGRHYTTQSNQSKVTELAKTSSFKGESKTIESGPNLFTGEEEEGILYPPSLDGAPGKSRIRATPYMISKLPKKSTHKIYCSLTQEQLNCYQSVIDEVKTSLPTLQRSDSDRQLFILKKIMRLKQICNHPVLFTESKDYSVHESGKCLRLQKICQDIHSRQEKVVIFTQFRKMIPYLQEFVSSIFLQKGLVLHGGTSLKARKSLVNEFQNPESSPFFIISVRTQGVELNLTAASHVIHFDRWWNPAVENKATHQIFRVGQQKDVEVHTLITKKTVEEMFDKVIFSKQVVDGKVINNKSVMDLRKLSDKELLDFISLHPSEF